MFKLSSGEKEALSMSIPSADVTPSLHHKTLLHHRTPITCSLSHGGARGNIYWATNIVHLESILYIHDHQLYNSILHSSNLDVALGLPSNKKLRIQLTCTRRDTGNGVIRPFRSA
jgi:hypothetical protein